MARYYFDTSIWMDFFENRDEPGLPKGKLAKALIKKIISGDDEIVYSDAVIDELTEQGYSHYELNELFGQLNRLLIYSEIDKKHIGKAKDLSVKRNIPLLDAIHALIARENNAVMITRDGHFKHLADIVDSESPEEVI